MQRMGWAGMKNGALLARADRAFDALVTPDRHLRHQQNLGRLTRLGIVLLAGGRLRPDTVLAAAPARCADRGAGGGAMTRTGGASPAIATPGATPPAGGRTAGAGRMSVTATTPTGGG